MIINFLIPCFFLITITHSTQTLIPNNHKLIYTQCSNLTTPKPNPSHLSLLPNLFQQLTTHSSHSTSFQTIVSNDKTAISGSFQCRKDLTTDECRTCVSKFPNLSKALCGANLPAKIQLRGCYIRYEEGNDYSEDLPGQGQILHLACSGRRARRRGFEEMKKAAFEAAERCVVMSDEGGFCEMVYESIHVLAQCVEGLRRCDCGECVNRAVEIACEDEECRDSVVGEVYVDGCFVSYDYRDGGFGTFNGGGDRLPKLLAIVVGGLAILAVGIGLCYFAKSCGKKKKDDW